MKRPFPCRPSRYPSSRARAGYTMVEILMATALTLMMIGAVVEVFARIGNSVNNSRATLETADRLRVATTTLQRDLGGLTVVPDPPRRPDDDEGYLEVIEGPVGVCLPEYGGITSNTPFISPLSVAVDRSDPSNPVPDTTVGDFDDILMFTTRRSGEPFVGRYFDPRTNEPSSIQSDVAEVAWFVRGRTLYRRVRLVVPAAEIDPNPQGFYALNDIAVRRVGNALVPCTLGDLTKRRNRFAHNPHQFPFDASDASQEDTGWAGLGLPTLCECCSTQPTVWQTGDETPDPNYRITADDPMDFWGVNPYPQGWEGRIDPESGNRIDYLQLTQAGYYEGERIAEDVILTNVIGFDVKVWDPDMQMYVDLGYNPGGLELTVSAPNRRTQVGPFAGLGDPRSELDSYEDDGTPADPPRARVYCTWSDHYEYDGVLQRGSTIDPATNGFDDNGNGIVDDITERETMPPYPAPLRGIQVKIRVFEPDSRQVREMTVVQDFLPR